MVENSSIGEEAEITVIVDDVDGCDWVFVAFLTNSHYFLAADIVAVEMEAGTVFEERLIAAERLEVLPICGQFPHIHPPDEVAQV